MGDINFAELHKTMNQQKPRRRVLFLFAHLHKGGMQRAVSNISLALPDEFEQYVGFFGTENPPFDYNAILHDFNVPGSSEFGLFTRLKNFFRRLRKLRKFVKAQRIDVVASFGEAANILNMLSFNSAYRVIGIRGAADDRNKINPYDWLYQRLVRWTYSLPNAIVAVSFDLKRWAEKLSRRRVPVFHVPNMYHLDRIRALSVELLPPNLSSLAESRFILNVGSLVSRPKAQDILIRAFANISDSFLDLRLVLIGRGSDKDKYIAEAKKLGISDRVIIIDFDSNPYRYMRRATIFVLPSLYEGFPNVLVEAMACSCPVIAFDCPTGPREILGDSEYGELVENMTVEALTERLHGLLSSAERLAHVKKQAVIRAEHYDAKHLVGQWVNILYGHHLN
jgi:glycosyltransferase involved in cell wall biosynthesis